MRKRKTKRQLLSELKDLEALRERARKDVQNLNRRINRKIVQIDNVNQTFMLGLYPRD